MRTNRNRFIVKFVNKSEFDVLKSILQDLTRYLTLAEDKRRHENFAEQPSPDPDLTQLDDSLFPPRSLHSSSRAIPMPYYDAVSDSEMKEVTELSSSFAPNENVFASMHTSDEIHLSSGTSAEFAPSCFSSQDIDSISFSRDDSRAALLADFDVYRSSSSHLLRSLSGVAQHPGPAASTPFPGFHTPNPLQNRASAGQGVPNVPSAASVPSMSTVPQPATLSNPPSGLNGLNGRMDGLNGLNGRMDGLNGLNGRMDSAQSMNRSNPSLLNTASNPSLLHTTSGAFAPTVSTTTTTASPANHFSPFTGPPLRSSSHFRSSSHGESVSSLQRRETEPIDLFLAPESNRSFNTRDSSGVSPQSEASGWINREYSIRANQNVHGSFLNRYYGMYTLEVFGQTLYFVVMENILPYRNIDEVFDLKVAVFLAFHA